MNSADTWISEGGRVKHRDRYGRENEWTQEEARDLWAALGKLLGINVEQAERVAVQISTMEKGTAALCNDGTIWQTRALASGVGAWERLPPLPQDRLEPVKASAAVSRFVATAERVDATPDVRVRLAGSVPVGNGVLPRPGELEVPGT